jgi:hypothetical protein
VLQEQYSPEQLQNIAILSHVHSVSEDDVKKRRLWISLDGVSDWSEDTLAPFKEPVNPGDAMQVSKRRQRLQRSQRTAYSFRIFAQDGWDVSWSQPQKIHVPGSKAYPIMGIRAPLLEQQVVEPGDILQFERMPDHLDAKAFAKNMGPPPRGSVGSVYARPPTGLMCKSLIPAPPEVVAPMPLFFKCPGLARVPAKASIAKPSVP